jgi:hypothetical protein
MDSAFPRMAFLDALLSRCTADGARLTLTALHPDGRHRTPSRHIPLHDTAALHAALRDLDRANTLGWGAYFAVGLRRAGLSRWQRGGVADVVVLPALFVDVDDPSMDALRRLQCADPAPSCIVASGGGYHAYWWLNEPTSDLHTAHRVLYGLAAALHGDRLSIAQSLRLPGSRNTKPGRCNARCRVLTLGEQRYPLDAFAAHRSGPAETSSRADASSRRQTRLTDSALIARVSAALLQAGYTARGDWLSGPCPFPHRHKHADRHPSFGFNLRTGYGFCHVCGTLLMKELCPALGISSVR